MRYNASFFCNREQSGEDDKHVNLFVLIMSRVFCTHSHKHNTGSSGRIFLESGRCRIRGEFGEHYHWCLADEWLCLPWHWISQGCQFLQRGAANNEHNIFRQLATYEINWTWAGTLINTSIFIFVLSHSQAIWVLFVSLFMIKEII